MSIILLILGLVLFVLLVAVHEAGHFIMARRNGVEVQEFGIGFPPRAKILAKKKGTIYSLNWLPLGGFVRLKGEHDNDEKPGTYGAASLGTKVKIMTAGVVMNLFAAFVLLTIVAIFGMPQLVNNQFTIKSDTKVTKNEVIIGYVEPDSPAAKSGLRSDDQLEAIGKIGSPLTQVHSAERLPDVTKALAGQKVVLEYERAGQQHKVSLVLQTAQVIAASEKTANPKGYLGISPTQYSLQRSTWSAPIVAVGFSAQVTALTFQGLGHALGGLGSLIGGIVTGNTTARQNGQANATAQVAGPVGIFVILKDGSLLGYQFILTIVGVISLTLAIMNILPIPALDGGKLFVTLVFRALHRPLRQNVEDWIQGAGFALLLLLITLITIVDVQRFF